jgi:hypothetical protein
MKVELCNFSGYKIYPSKGKLYVRGDSKVRKNRRLEMGWNRTAVRRGWVWEDWMMDGGTVEICVDGYGYVGSVPTDGRTDGTDLTTEHTGPFGGRIRTSPTETS